MIGCRRTETGTDIRLGTIDQWTTGDSGTHSRLACDGAVTLAVETSADGGQRVVAASWLQLKVCQTS